MVRMLGLALVGALALASGGCTTKSCTDNFVCPTYSVRVSDAATKEPVCTGTVSLSPGATTQCGEQSASAQNCVFVIGIPDQVPTADITVTSAGYVTKTVTVSTQYPTDDCGKAIAVPVAVAVEKSQ